MDTYRASRSSDYPYYGSVTMHVLGLTRTARLWYRLDHESQEYYRALHAAKNQVQHTGPNVFSDLPAVFSDLDREYHRLKRRFIVMTVIGRSVSLANTSLSDLVRERAVWLFGVDILSELDERCDNVRLR